MRAYIACFANYYVSYEGTKTKDINDAMPFNNHIELYKWCKARQVRDYKVKEIIL